MSNQPRNLDSIARLRLGEIPGDMPVKDLSNELEEHENPSDPWKKALNCFLEDTHPEKVYFGVIEYVEKDTSGINAWDTNGLRSEQIIQTATLQNMATENPKIFLDTPVRLETYSFSGDEIRRICYCPLHEWPDHLQRLYGEASKSESITPELECD